MKIRVRLPDGSTLKLNVEGATTYGELLDMSGGSGNYLSLNKREPLTHDRAIRLAQLGLASGDLIYLVAPAGAAPAPGVVRGSGKKEGSAECVKLTCVPIWYQVL